MRANFTTSPRGSLKYSSSANGRLRDVIAFRAAVKRDDDDIVGAGKTCNSGAREIVVEQHVRVTRDGVGHHRDLQSVELERREVALEPGVENAGGRECLHRGNPAFVAEVAGMIVCEAHDVEARIAVMLDVA